MSEVEKLIQAAQRIEAMTDGRQRLVNDPAGSLKIQTKRDDVFALEMHSRYLPTRKCREIKFAVSVQRKAQAMDTAGMACLLHEARQMQALLLELGQQEYCPSMPELTRFQEYLIQRDADQPRQDAPNMGHSQIF